ncbi:MAG: PAS domain S-box protein [Chloroflexota bacterium]
MPALYFTPASIGYLTQFILSLAITGYLVRRCLSKRENQSTQTALLTCLFAASTLFIGLLLLDAVLLPAPRLYIVYLENTVLGVVLVLLLQFAYRFPSLFPHRKRESYVALGLSLLYTLYEALFAVYRFSLLLGQGTVDYRFLEADYALAVLFVWAPVVFLRQTIFADERPVHWLRKLWKPQGLEARGAHSFALVFILLLALSVINILEGFSFIPTTIFSASLSLGILVAIWLFARAYLNFLPEKTSFLVKLSGITLTLLLAVLGLVGWAVSPAYVAAFQPAITDHQTLRFTPNALGGYDVISIPFTFETDLGDRLPVPSSHTDIRSRPVNFTFSFYGKTYSKIYVTSVGVLSMGQQLHHANLQYDYKAYPCIFPLLVDLKPESGGGMFARVEPERLIVTWDHMQAIDYPNSIYTFQTVLYRDGSFDITYNGLPNPLTFSPDAQASSNPWLRGATPGLTAPVEQVDDLSQPMQSKSRGVIQDFYMDFRHHLHDFISPLAWLIVISSLFIIFGLPFLINSNLVKPLNALLTGIGQMEGGDLTVEMPIQHHDEIGSLTSSFNAMAAQLRLYVTELEQRVAARTQELQILNTQLKAEARERQQAEEALKESKQIAEDMFEFTPDALLMVDETGRITRVNKQTQIMFGYAREELLRQQIDILIPLRFHSKHAQEQTDFFAEPHMRPMGSHRELFAMKRDGREFPVDILLSPLQLGGRTFVTAVVRDITERKLAEEALKSSEARYRAVTQSASEAIISSNSQGHIVGWNDSAEVIFGYSEDEALNQPLTFLMPSRFHEEHHAGMARVNSGGEKHIIGKTVEVQGQRKDGSEFPLEMSLAEWQVDDAQFYTAIIRDITERRQAEKKLLQIQNQVIEQQRTMATFEERERVARELHDGIGQTLGYVNVQTQAVQTLLEKNQLEAARRNLGEIVQVAQDAHANLRHTILGLRDSLPPQRDFYQALQAYLSSFHQAWGIETNFSPPQDELPVLPAAVEDQLLHIVQEALVNIRKHAEARRVEVLISLRPGEMTLIISDDGRGFDPQLAPGAEREHFGLSIMRERAEQVGGRMEMRSVIGRGTQVFVYIPTVSTPASASRENPKDMYSLRILLVDDQPLFLDGMRNLLTARGLTVIGTAGDGLEACEQVKALRPDVVLMDVQMPKCDGIEATRLIKTEFPETKVVLLTVSEDEEHLLDAIKYGASSYLLKNLDANQLFSTLEGLARDEVQIAPELASRLLKEFNRAGTVLRSASDVDETIPAELTVRQWEVLRLVARGLTYKEAGRELNVTEQAIKYHMAQILDRLQVKNREQAIAYLRQVQETRKKKDPKPRGATYG